MASAAKRSKSNGRSEEASRSFAICVCNDGYTASLELRKLYEVITDSFAAERGLVRVVDESGEDYLYSERWFLAVSLPRAIEAVLRRTPGRNPAA